ncbi:HesA/MoeB/ThiF family protein [Candidatus Pantoea multigeneris]|uniref:ThiF family adenylyltransferase n=1 Tax=Candidatus Pantoea multigeneris TaxID=2608357 RepID=A0ABX0RAD8_9GAMM|nr:ThiF family adenylyltransferase [Pantoea multigeneris]NIF20429.1 ThiF family adenylyltransferase [Pantoea multigeneris]
MNKSYRMRQSVGIIQLEDLVEFYKSNVRVGIKLKMKHGHISELLKQFNGEKSLNDILNNNPLIKGSQLINLVNFLNENNILIESDVEYPHELAETHYRIINLLEDYCISTSEVLSIINKIKKSKVAIIGLGAVGSNISVQLAQSGVESFVIVDCDIVELSNLHRQSYFENEISELKVDALSNQLYNFGAKSVEKINKRLTDIKLDDGCPLSKVDLIINCADEPSVDFTSEIIAKHCMNYKIPHIVGGGYNLHQTLIGQTIIPYETACFNCFRVYLDSINTSELAGVRKLHRESRKLGSYSPLSGIAASLACLDSIKLLSGKKEYLQQANKRIEFSLRTSKFNNVNVERHPQCEWCGEKNG